MCILCLKETFIVNKARWGCDDFINDFLLYVLASQEVARYDVYVYIMYEHMP